MPLKPYDQQQPDPPADCPLWRFMPLEYFQDFMANEELYLRRCDKYTKNDPQDGIPTDHYIRKIHRLRRYDVHDEMAVIAHQGSNRLLTEIFYLSCWNLYRCEHEMQMWHEYTKEHKGVGVAVKTTFGKLQAAVAQFPDDMHMGVVRYGDEDMTGDNLLQSLFTKGTKFRWENEVRVALWGSDPKGGQARNYDENNVPHREALDDLYQRHSWVHDCKRRRLLLKDVITGIAVSPWAPEEVVTEVQEEWATVGQLKVPVDPHVRSSLVLRPLEKVVLNHFQSRMFWSILGHASLPSTPHPLAQASPGQSGLAASGWNSTSSGGSSRSRPHPVA